MRAHILADYYRDAKSSVLYWLSRAGIVSRETSVLSRLRAFQAQLQGDPDARALTMPTEADAIQALHSAYLRLQDLGWRDPAYMLSEDRPMIGLEVSWPETFRCRPDINDPLRAVWIGTNPAEPKQYQDFPFIPALVRVERS